MGASAARFTARWQIRLLPPLGDRTADYIIDLMSRDLIGFFTGPVADRKPVTLPGAGIWGPKVMIINEATGSGATCSPAWSG